MWNKTRATKLLRIRYPIIQGPFGGRFSSAKLVSTVSNAGGLGSFGLNAYAPDEIQEVDTKIKSLTKKPYTLNLWVPLKDDPIHQYRPEDYERLRALFQSYFDELGVPLPEFSLPAVPDFEGQIEAVFKAKPPVISFVFGIPSKEIIRELKTAKIITIGTATTVEEAALVEQAGLDLVVASGAAAGGHRASFLRPAEESLTETFSLVAEVGENVKIPVIAAGGIADGEAISSALLSGASAVQIGTAFLATNESNATVEHKQKLLHHMLDTVLTKVYTGRLARVLSNKLSEEFAHVLGYELAPYPAQAAFIAPLRAAAIAQGRHDFMPLWSGQPSVILKHASAKTLLESLVAEVAALYK